MGDITCYIALGSNLNNPLKQLALALENLQQISQTHLEKTSSFYWSKPFNKHPHPDYLNAVCQLKTCLSAKALLSTLQQIERKQGRPRNHLREKPRTLDLDLLLYGDEIITDDELTIPHPRMHQRDFVLIPLAELNPNLKLPKNILLKTLITSLTEKTLLYLS